MTEVPRGESRRVSPELAQAYLDGTAVVDLRGEHPRYALTEAELRRKRTTTS